MIIIFIIAYLFVAISSSQFNGSSPVDMGVLIFPTAEDLVNYTLEIQPLLAMLPPGLIEERLRDTSMDSSKFQRTFLIADKSI